MPGLATVLGEGPGVRVVTICGDTTTARLPAECGAVAGADDAGRLVLRVTGGHDCNAVVPDGVGATWCEATARGLAPLRDETAGDGAAAGLPPSVHLVELLARAGLDATDPAALARSWRRRPRATTVALGSTPSGTWTVDLRTDGPHVLVGGTTGAGKSELLQTLVAALALANRPEEMSFVLVDFKGGAAFGSCASLPHTAGVVTDLDAHLTARALESLAAEVRRRERALAEAGVADLEAYQQLSDTGSVPSLARLVIVVDEYRALAEELPDLMDSPSGSPPWGGRWDPPRARDPAPRRRRGRRPARQRQPPDRAARPRRRRLHGRRGVPRRGLVGPVLAPGACSRAHRWRAPVPVQVARVAGHGARRAGPSVDVRRVGWATLGDPSDGHTAPEAAPRTAGSGGLGPDRGRRRPTRPGADLIRLRPDEPRPDDALPDPTRDSTRPTRRARPDPTLPDSGASDLTLVVGAVRAAADLAAARPAAGPWLPPLPDRLGLAGPADRAPTEGGAARWGGLRGCAGPVLTLGVVDLPGEQRTAPLCWDLSAGAGLVVAGSPRSGRTGVVRAVLAGVAACSPDAVDVHLLTGGGAPAGPGGAAPRRDRRRHRRPGARDAAAGADGRGGRASPRRPRRPWGRAPGLLIVDGAERLVPALEGSGGGRGVDLLLDVLRTGPGAGVLTLLTGDRSVLTGRLGGTPTGGCSAWPTPPTCSSPACRRAACRNGSRPDGCCGSGPTASTRRRCSTSTTPPSRRRWPPPRRDRPGTATAREAARCASVGCPTT